MTTPNDLVAPSPAEIRDEYDTGSPAFSFHEYETHALKTVSPTTDQTRDTIYSNARILRGVLETMVAFGRDIEKIKKSIFYGKYLDASTDLNFLKTYDAYSDEAVFGPPLYHLTDEQIHLLHAVLGVMDEAGELTLNILFPQKMENPDDKGGVVEEVGDALWYLTLALRSVKRNLETAARTNNAKLLKVRYKSGAFSQAEALNRDLHAEAEALQSAKLTPEAILEARDVADGTSKARY